MKQKTLEFAHMNRQVYPQKQQKQQSLESGILYRIIQKQPQFIDVDAIQIGGKNNQNLHSLMQSNTGHFSEPSDVKKQIKIIQVITQNHSFVPYVNQSSSSRVGEVTHQFEGSMPLIPRPNNYKLATKLPEKKLQTWTRQNFLKYFCFMEHHKDIFKRKQLWINKNCFEYIGFKNRQSYGAKHRYLKVYHKSIEAINNSIKNLYHFSHAEIERENKQIVEFLEKMRIQQKYFLNESFQFQQYLQSMNIKPIDQLFRISFSQTMIESSSLKYSIINLENKLDKSKKPIFHGINQKVKNLYLLFEASFKLKETEVSSITEQIVLESDLIEQETPSHSELFKQIEQQKKPSNLGELRKIIQAENDKLATQTIHFKNKRKYETCKSKKVKRSSYKCIQLREQKIQGESQDNKKKEFSKQEKIEQSSKQWLDLSTILGLKKQQIWRLELLTESKINEFRVMRKSANSLEVQYTQFQKQKSQTKTKTKKTKKASKQAYNEDDKDYKQMWTEQQISRLLAFMVLNKKMFINVHNIQKQVLRLMLEFLKSRNYMQTQKKYNTLIENCQNLEDVVQSAFQKYKFTKEQFQAELKRQYQRYLNNPSTIILQGEKIMVIKVPADSTETKIMSIIESRIISEPIEIMCINSGRQDDSLTGRIQKHIKEFKQEHQITQNLKKAQINLIYQRMATNIEALPPIEKFRNLAKHLENGRQKSENRNGQKAQRNKLKLLKFMRCFPQQTNFQLRILVEFRIKKSAQSLAFASVQQNSDSN